MFREVIRGRDYSGVHMFGCTCRSCRPPHPSDTTIKPWAWAVGLGLLVLAIWVTW